MAACSGRLGEILVVARHAQDRIRAWRDGIETASELYLIRLFQIALGIMPGCRSTDSTMLRWMQHSMDALDDALVSGTGRPFMGAKNRRGTDLELHQARNPYPWFLFFRNRLIFILIMGSSMGGQLRRRMAVLTEAPTGRELA